MEQFEVFDDDNQLLGLMPRDEVHRCGHWHKSAQVFVFNQQEQLLIQRRAADKDLYAGLWDYSVGEHLSPGEDFCQGAMRGLQEELCISEVQLQPLGGLRHVQWRGDNYWDREIQQAFLCHYDGPVVADPVEVARVRHISLTALAEWVVGSEAEFTPWFVDDLRIFGWL